MNNYNKNLPAILALLLCATGAPPLSWADVLVDPSVTLPVTIETIWYRTGGTDQTRH